MGRVSRGLPIRTWPGVNASVPLSSAGRATRAGRLLIQAFKRGV